MNNNRLPNPKAGKEIEPKLETKDWYQGLIENCEAILKETIYIARTEIIKGKWLLGEAILQANENFEREKIYGSKIVTHVAESLQLRRIPISPREVWRCIQFAKKYPNLIKDNVEIAPDAFPEEGMNISWSKIVRKYLPSPVKESELLEECKHPESEISEISYLKCGKCGKYLEEYSRTLSKESVINDIENWAEANSFPKYNINEGGAIPFVLDGEKEWKEYLENKFRTLPELWKIWKRIEGKFSQRLQRSDSNLWKQDGAVAPAVEARPVEGVATAQNKCNGGCRQPTDGDRRTEKP